MLTVAAFLTSALSGAFGMIGGLLLMGVYAAVLAPAPAIALHGVTQAVANGARAAGLWRWVDARVVGWYALGAAAATLALRGARLDPDPAWVWLGLGAVPWLARAAPRMPGVQRPAVAVAVGAAVTGVQAVCGVAGPLLDVFFLDTDLDRRAIVATKAATQLLAHAAKIVLYAHAVTLDGQVLGLALAALAGTAVGTAALHRMGDGTFQVWTRRLVLGVGAAYLARGAWAALG